MMLRVIAIGVVSGASLTHFFRALPACMDLFICSIVMLVCGMVIAWLSRLRGSARVFRLICIVVAFIASLMVGMTWTVFQAHIRLDDALSVTHENVVTRLTFRVHGMAQDQTGQQRFEAQVLEPAPAGIPSNILVNWQDPVGGKMVVLPGQIWRAALVLKRPHAATNPSGFDFEAHMFQKNIRAIGKVRGQPRLLGDDPFFSLAVGVSRVRHHIRHAMRQVLGDARYAPVLIALAIGDQDSVSASDWDVFNRTGITHLVSISGSHVTMLAAFGGVSMLWLWKRIRISGRPACERIPAKVVAACASLLVAFLYCLLAGWGVPARRTFFMLFVIGLSMITRLSIKPTTILSVAAAIVTILDPWSPLATGFWLSFGAVLVLFAAGAQTLRNAAGASKRSTFISVLKESARLQWLITLAMTPVIAFLFQQISLISPFANAIAIPVVTFVVTPLAILIALICLIPGADVLAWGFGWLANMSMQLAMEPIIWLSQSKWAMLDIAVFPLWLLLLAMAGTCWALLPPGVPVRWAGWCLILPALVGKSERTDEGAWKMLALDVGQGSSILVTTRRHALLFDTGARQGSSNSGQRVISPVMRALGIDKLDALMVSHSDMDHAGGLAYVLTKYPVEAIYASFDAPAWLARTQGADSDYEPGLQLTRFLFCHRGQQWTWDGVMFTVLHPDLLHGQNRKKNANSCVIHIAGAYHSALLTGDVGAKEEIAIIESQPGLGADVVVAAHHGSASSSSELFVRQLRAQHTIIQAGYLNRFKHPDEMVLNRWRDHGAVVWRTDHQGAIDVHSQKHALHVKSHRTHIKKYWHH
jgi:competence protein ComEC